MSLIDPEEMSQKMSALLSSIKRNLPKLEKLLSEVNDHWVGEDGFYRFYHHSNKVFDRLQPQTQRIMEALQSVMPDCRLNWVFIKIIKEGIDRGPEVSLTVPEKWLKESRPVVEAFFHAKYMLEMVVKYGSELDEPPATLPSGWAAVLTIYGLR